METLGDYLRSLRESKRVSRNVLSSCLKIPEASLQALEADHRLPNLNEVRRICAFFGVPRDEVILRIPSRAAQRRLPTIGQGLR